MLLSVLAMPTMAVDVLSTEDASYTEIVLLNEVTRIYWRTFNGNLQFRVWGVTSGRWLTEWQNFVN